MSQENNGGNMRWVPLESNPEVLNRFIHKLGESVGNSDAVSASVEKII